jgi:hypothetical protein
MQVASLLLEKSLSGVSQDPPVLAQKLQKIYRGSSLHCISLCDKNPISVRRPAERRFHIYEAHVVSYQESPEGQD